MFIPDRRCSNNCTILNKPGLFRNSYFLYFICSFDMSNKTQIPSIHLLKLICSLMVVQIHLESFIKESILPLCQIAVPIYLMISGYFLLSKNNINHNGVLKHTHKIFKIFLTANIVYFIFGLIRTSCYTEDFHYYLSTKTWVKWLLFGTSWSIHLWYLTVCLQILIVIYFTLRFSRINVLYYLLPFFFIIGILLRTPYTHLSPTINKIMGLSGALPLGLCWFLIGSLIRKLNLISMNRYIAPVICLAITSFICSPNNLNSLSWVRICLTTILAASVFTTFLQIKNTNNFIEYLSEIGKKHSTNIYLWHPILYGVCLMIVELVPYSLDIKSNLTSIEAFLVFIGCIYLSKLFRMVQNMKFKYPNVGYFSRLKSLN